MKRFNLSAWAVSHPPLVLFLIIALGVAGFFSYQKLGRAEDPFFTVKVVNVSVMWPGATAVEMQSQVADPIEKKLQELPYFEKVQTYSKPAFTAMQVTFRDSTPPKEVPHLFYLIRKKLDDVQSSLPSGIVGPFVNDEFSDVDSILFMMTGDGADYAQLKKTAEGLRQRLLKVAGVTKVNLYGTQDERIYVEFSHAKLATLGITPQALFDSLAKQNAKNGVATVSLWSEPGKSYAARLREIAPAADPATRTYLAKFSLPDANDNVSLGMTATLTLSDPVTTLVARLPLSALFSDGRDPSLYVVNDKGEVVLKPVKVKSYESKDVLVTSGVDEGEKVVALGVQKIDPAQKVRVVSALTF